MKYQPLPAGVAEDFRQISRASDFRHSVALKWVDHFGAKDAPSLSAGVTRFRDRTPLAVVGVNSGISVMAQPLVDAGWSVQEAERWVRRHVLSHEAGHVRQVERGHGPLLDENEANDWAYVVFLRLGWDHSVTEFLARRWPPGRLWREHEGRL